MPSINVTGTADVLDSEDDLFDLLKQLKAADWVGTLEVGADHVGDDAEVTWTLNAHTADPLATDGMRRLNATVGDYKVIIGTVVTVLTPDAYAATYGA